MRPILFIGGGAAGQLRQRVVQSVVAIEKRMRKVEAALDHGNGSVQRPRGAALTWRWRISPNASRGSSHGFRMYRQIAARVHCGIIPAVARRSKKGSGRLSLVVPWRSIARVVALTERIRELDTHDRKMQLVQTAIAVGQCMDAIAQALDHEQWRAWIAEVVPKRARVVHRFIALANIAEHRPWLLMSPHGFHPRLPHGLPPETILQGFRLDLDEITKLVRELVARKDELSSQPGDHRKAIEDLEAQLRALAESLSELSEE